MTPARRTPPAPGHKSSSMRVPERFTPAPRKCSGTSSPRPFWACRASHDQREPGVPDLLGSAGGPTIGVFADCTDRSMPIVGLAVALEERGFTGIYLNEHPHLPVANERSSFPAGGDIPDRYARFWDPYIALSFVAARTSLDIGTCISLVGEHDAIALAKAIATLDVLSGGRLHVGVGFGWHREEFEDHGLPAEVRAPVVEETVALMKQLWTQDVASYEGTYRQLSPSR